MQLSTLWEGLSVSAPLEKVNWKEENEEVMNKAAGYGPGSYAKAKEEGFYGAILSHVEQQRGPFDNYDWVIRIFTEMIKGSQAFRFQCLQGRL